MKYIILALFLAACTPSPAPVVVGNCPQVKTFTKQQQAEILQAEKALPDDSPLLPVLYDWVRMRDELRAR